MLDAKRVHLTDYGCYDACPRCFDAHELYSVGRLLVWLIEMQFPFVVTVSGCNRDFDYNYLCSRTIRRGHCFRSVSFRGLLFFLFCFIYFLLETMD